MGRDDRRRRFIANAVGAVTLHEVLTLARARQSSRYRDYSLLLDVRVLNPPTPDDIRLLRERVGSVPLLDGPPGPTAIVLDSIALRTLWSMYQGAVQRSGLVIRTFQNPADAERWLTECAR